MAKSGGVLILAAGVSRRFGSDKRRHRLDNGSTLLLTTISVYRQVFDSVIVVLRQEDDIEADVSARFTDVRCIHAPLARLGMGHSLAAGIDSVSDWDYAFVALADMPSIHPHTLRLLRGEIEAGTDGAIIQPQYHGEAGHPVAFHRRFFAELSQIQGDRGAREVLQRHPDALRRVETDDPGVIEDFDTPS